MSQFSALEILAIVRRYMEAVADGRIDAKDVPAMTDERLAEYDREIYTKLTDKQAEAETLAAEPEKKDEE